MTAAEWGHAIAAEVAATGPGLSDEERAASRLCARCGDEAMGLGSSASCVCGPNVPCGWCGQGQPSLDDQMALAVRAMAHHAGAASRVDRTGWTDEQWIEDAECLMGDLHGSVSSLVNGHVMALLNYWRARRTPPAAVGSDADPDRVIEGMRNDLARTTAEGGYYLPITTHGLRKVLDVLASLRAAVGSDARLREAVEAKVGIWEQAVAGYRLRHLRDPKISLGTVVTALRAALDVPPPDRDETAALAGEWESVKCGVLGPGLRRAATDLRAALERPGIVQNPGGQIMGVDHDFAVGGPQNTPLGSACPNPDRDETTGGEV